jgi:hypothetical protein
MVKVHAHLAMNVPEISLVSHLVDFYALQQNTDNSTVPI